MSYDAAHRYERLRRIAEDDAATETEKVAARDAMARLRVKHPERDLEMHERVLRVNSEAHAQLIVHAAARHGCAVTVRTGTDEATLRGPVEAVKTIEREVTRHAERLEAFLANVTLAYIRGADLYADAETKAAPGTTREAPSTGLTEAEEEALIRALQGFQRLGHLKRSVDATRRRLPAPASPRVQNPYGNFFFMLQDIIR